MVGRSSSPGRAVARRRPAGAGAGRAGRGWRRSRAGASWRDHGGAGSRATAEPRPRGGRISVPSGCRESNTRARARYTPGPGSVPPRNGACTERDRCRRGGEGARRGGTGIQNEEGDGAAISSAGGRALPGAGHPVAAQGAGRAGRGPAPAARGGEPRASSPTRSGSPPSCGSPTASGPPGFLAEGHGPPHLLRALGDGAGAGAAHAGEGALPSGAGSSTWRASC
jgi:hypothetical protein